MYRDDLFKKFVEVFGDDSELADMRVFAPYENTLEDKGNLCCGVCLSNEQQIDRSAYMSMEGLVQIESNFDYDQDKSMLSDACNAFEALIASPSNFDFGSSTVDDIIVETVTENMIVENRNARLYTLKIMITK